MDRRPARPVLLIVEDDASTRTSLAELLGQDWDVLTAEDGTEAVALTQAHVPDLVLADLAMPKLGGMGLLEVLQSDARTREVPVVFLSGQSDPRTVVDCFSHGAADFVAKPGRPDEVRARLLHAWGQARRVARLESLARTDSPACTTSGRSRPGSTRSSPGRRATRSRWRSCWWISTS
jgi:putative two-component system response regulator